MARRNTRNTRNTAVEPTTPPVESTTAVAVDATEPPAVEPPAVEPPAVEPPAEPPATVDPTAPPTSVAAYVAAVESAITDDAARAEMLTPGCRAIAAGLMAVRTTAANPDAIRTAVAAFIDAARAEHPAIDDRDHVARWTARNITTGQNVVYAVNNIVRCPDAAVAVAWVSVWPGAKCDYADKHRYIASTRTDTNNARHGWTRDDVARYGGPFHRFGPSGAAL